MQKGGDNFGRAVSLSADGTRLAVGASDKDGSNPLAGRMCVFRYSAAIGAWEQVGANIDSEWATLE